jgi:hypothetical protein
MLNNKKNNAARVLFVGAKVFNLVSAKVDAGHKAKGSELRIEIPAMIHTTKCTVVNEVKLQKGPGGMDLLHVNGGPDKVTIPCNYEFGSDKTAFESSKVEEGNPVFFASFADACNIANAANEAELIRLKLIRDDLNAQINAISSAMKANEDAKQLHNEDEE